MHETTDPGRLEYAHDGLIGCLTPQANTTVEAEFNILLPAGFALLNARLTSRGHSIEARLADYMQRLEEQHSQFGNAPLQAVALATTGASYLVGRHREDALVGSFQDARGVPLITAARAVCDALATLHARRVALVSPYPDGLTGRSVDYWESRGIAVAEVRSVYAASDAFHPIYSLRSQAASGALDALRDSDVDAIVMLGTGFPTLRPIAERAAWGGPAVLSCMLCLAWRAVVAARGPGQPLDTSELRRWVAATHWRNRLPSVPSAGC